MAEAIDIRELNIRIEQQSQFVTNLVMGMNKVIVGQKHLVDCLLIGLLSDGHILLEGVPGLAKTLAIKTLSQLVSADYSRIQFTPDLLPADVVGTQIYSQKDEAFHVKRGPVFANFVLADEINRAPAKVQSALLEAMQEHQVTIGEQTFKLPNPFLVMGMNKVIVGQKHLVDCLLIGLLSDGHILLEGVPGLAKTLAIKTLSQLISADYSRIQFTPDLLPADVIGTQIYSQKDEAFHVKRGPVFANFVLADEINRAPAKVQSALLEAMQEHQVTIGEQTFHLPNPFLVMATQNPVEQEGTYQLPEAQVDRFLLKVVIDYPTIEEEKLIIRENIQGGLPTVTPVTTAEEILKARSIVNEVYIDEKIEQYIADIVFATRYPDRYGLGELKDMITFGGSPRASISLAKAARAYAFIKHRGYVIPEDVRAVAHDVLRHRIGLSYEAEASEITSEEIVSRIINKVEVP